MNMNKPWQVSLTLIAIFAAGGISGGLVAWRVARRNALRFTAPEVWVGRHFDHLARAVNLTREQKVRIEPIVKRNTEELVKLRRQWFRTSRAILERMETSIAAELTPEQRPLYEQYLKERRERTRRMTPEQRSLHGERDRPPGEKPPPPDAGSEPPNPAEKAGGT